VRNVRAILVFAILCVVALALIEGVASLIVVGHQAWSGLERPLAERSHTRYDPEIGWVNEVNVRLPGFYGPGRTLTTSSRGFRGTLEIADQPAPGHVRIVCSGDSFTMGFGVGDADAWCHRLGVMDPRLETVNMGQGGYGIDQAWLLYRRESARLRPAVHLFAFITDDFARMQTPVFSGYGKPVLRLEDGQIRVQNVPVPRRAYYVPWLTQNLRLFGELRSVSVASSLARRIHVPAPDAPPVDALPLSLAVFDDLARIDREMGTRLVLVYLPERFEYTSEPPGGLRDALATYAAARRIDYVDVFTELRKLPSDRVDRLYLPVGPGPVPDLDGHYSVEGNQFVAEVLDRALRRLPPTTSEAARAR
jgi:hypothetical protein